MRLPIGWTAHTGFNMAAHVDITAHGIPGQIEGEIGNKLQFFLVINSL